MISRKAEEIKKDWERVWVESTSIEQELEQIELEYNYVKYFKRLFAENSHILEAGCGYGRYCLWFAKNRRKATGIDLVDKALKVGIRYAEEHNIDINLVEGDILNIPFSCEFDGYVSLGVLEHLRHENDVRTALEEAYRVLKPGGNAFISIPNPNGIPMIAYKRQAKSKKPDVWHSMLSITQLAKMAHQIGFSVDESRYEGVAWSLYIILRKLFSKTPRNAYIKLYKWLNWLDYIPLVKLIAAGNYIILRK